MLKPLLFFSVLAGYTSAFGQFNTVKVVKALPSIKVDTVLEFSQVPFPLRSDSVAQKPGMPSALGYSMPLLNPIVNSPYGKRTDPITGEASFHYGIDFRGEEGFVMAVMSGVVKRVGYSRGLGSYIELDHGAYTSVYGHLSSILVSQKTSVRAGRVMATVGSTGRSTGKHLHFALKHKGQVVNPAPLLDFIYMRLGEAKGNRPDLTAGPDLNTRR